MYGLQVVKEQMMVLMVVVIIISLTERCAMCHHLHMQW